MLWYHTKQYVHTVDAVLMTIIEQCKLVDKVRIAMFVTWLWALFGLYTAKAFESFFRLLLKMPDNWLVSVQPVNGVKIVSAHDGQRDITNKFKLFLKFYWEQDEDNTDLSNGGFSFASLQRLLNCSMLYCSYLLTDKDGSVDPERFWQNMNRFLVSLKESNPDTCVKYTTADMQTSEEVPFGTVRFNGKQRKRKTKHTNDQTKQDILAFINSRITDADDDKGINPDTQTMQETVLDPLT